MQFTIVKAVPLLARGALLATKVENKGESAMTTKPQNIRKRTKKLGDAYSNIKGATQQQRKEENNAKIAVFFVPIDSAK